ncbi:helix-turn-helix domain-containing protein [Haloarchaeobius sp. DT45]|uniref:helix-turn-helix domain-containing protein n=1 Tax=Haloarchaeobius sp. DT45 TaxID=3446116 RepID=UPI003F6CD173
MRSTTVTLTWGDSGLHPLYDAVASATDVAVDALYYINPVQNGGYAELIQLRGDLDRARTLLGTTPVVVEFEVSDAGIAYVHYESSPLVDELLELLFTHAVVLEWPVTFVTENGGPGARVTFLGTEDAISRAVADIPAAIGVTLERTGRYRGAGPTPASVLTDRQRDVLDAAVAAGYYEVPRQTTHRELASELGLAPGTVSEHLQRIECNILGALVDA